MNLVTAEEAERNERLREAPKRRCAACGARLNRYAASSRVLCTLCLQHDTEARLICARRLEAGRRAMVDLEGGCRRRLKDIEVDALHAGLWRMAGVGIASDLRVVPASGDRGCRGLGIFPQKLTGVPRRLVSSRERLRGIWHCDEEERRDPDVLLALIDQGYLVRDGYAAWSKVCMLWSVWRIYPRSYDPLGEPRR